MNYWEYDPDSYMHLKGNFVPKCPFHGKETPMMVRTAKLLNFSIDDNGEGEKNSHAVDVVMWCPECGYVDTFGVAVAKEHHEQVKQKIKDRMERSKEGVWYVFRQEELDRGIEAGIYKVMEKDK